MRGADLLGAQREREMCCKCLKYVRESGRGSQRMGVVICKVLSSAERERERCAVSAQMLERARGSERRGVVICRCLERRGRERDVL